MIFPHEMQMAVRALESDVGSATLKKSHNLLPAYLFTGKVWEFSILDAQEKGSSLLTVTGGGIGGFHTFITFLSCKVESFRGKDNYKNPFVVVS